MTNVCYDCKNEFPFLQKHHVIPRSQGGKDESGNLIFLCPNCHTIRHGGAFGTNLRMSPEVRAKRTEAMVRCWQDPKYRAKQAASRKRRFENRTPEELSSWRAAQSKAWTPERRARHAEVIRSRHTAEKGAAHAAKLAELWKDAKYRARQVAARRERFASMTAEQRAAQTAEARKTWTPERKSLQAILTHTLEAAQKRSRRMKELWADPEYRAQQSTSRKESRLKRKARSVSAPVLTT